MDALDQGRYPGTAWDEPNQRYKLLEQTLQIRGIPDNEIVMVNNSPGYYVASRRPAISIPYGNLQTVCTVAWRYQARYLLLEIDQISGESQLFTHPTDRQCLDYIDTIADVRVFEILSP